MDTTNEEEFYPKEEPQSIFRIISILSYAIVLVVIGVPVWLYTTRVYRADLPLQQLIDLHVPHMERGPQSEGSVALSSTYDLLITYMVPVDLTIAVNSPLLCRQLNDYLEGAISSAVASFDIRTQHVYYAHMGALNVKYRNDQLLLTRDVVSQLITQTEDKLGSHFGTAPRLNLIVHVAQCDRPVFVALTGDEDENSTNAFTSPGWGGVLILNPDNGACQTRHFQPDIKEMLPVFVAQMEALFHTGSDLLAFQRRKALELIATTKHTLKSLGNLLIGIRNLVIEEHVASMVLTGMQYADKAWHLYNSTTNSTGSTNVRLALKAAHIAHENAEAAFADPSLLALLYFPDDQKYAVYIPLFLPIIIPIIMSLSKVKIWYRSQYSSTSAKNKLD